MSWASFGGQMMRRWEDQKMIKLEMRQGKFCFLKKLKSKEIFVSIILFVIEVT